MERYLEGQEAGGSYACALEEMKKGRKCSCWIWYVFPQFRDPRRAASPNNVYYQLYTPAEAIAFLQHPVLGARLREIAAVALAHLEKGVAPTLLMGGSVDAKKLFQSASTFYLASKATGDEAAAALFAKLCLHCARDGAVLEDAVPLDHDMKQHWAAAPASAPQEGVEPA